MLVARVARRTSGIYYLIPRDYVAFGIESEEKWDPHASYHADGVRHFKSQNRAWGKDQRQPLGAGFAGVEDLFTQSFCPGGLEREQTEFRERDFNEMYMLPTEHIRPSDGVSLRVALCEPSHASEWSPGDGEEIARYWSHDATPWIELTVWRISFDRHLPGERRARSTDGGW